MKLTFPLFFDGDPAPGMGDPAHVEDSDPPVLDAPEPNEDELPLDALVLDEDEEPADPATPARTLTPDEIAKKNAKLAKTNRKLRRQLMRRVGPAQQDREDARSLREIKQAIQQGDPATRAQIAKMLGLETSHHGQATPPARGTKRDATPEPDDAEFDDSIEALGFDPNASQANKRLTTALKQIHDLQRTVTTLRGETTEQRQQTAKQQETAVFASWNTQAKAAADQINDPRKRMLFLDHVRAAYLLNRDKTTPEQVIGFYLQDYKGTGIPANQAALAANAAKKAAADKATNQSRSQAPNGRPASPDGNQRGPRLADVYKKIRGMAG